MFQEALESNMRSKWRGYRLREPFQPHPPLWISTVIVFLSILGFPLHYWRVSPHILLCSNSIICASSPPPPPSPQYHPPHQHSLSFQLDILVYAWSQCFRFDLDLLAAIAHTHTKQMDSETHLFVVQQSKTDNQSLKN